MKIYSKKNDDNLSKKLFPSGGPLILAVNLVIKQSRFLARYYNVFSFYPILLFNSMNVKDALYINCIPNFLALLKLKLSVLLSLSWTLLAGHCL